MKQVLKSFQTPSAVLALAVAAIGAVCAAPVAAQTRAALVQSVDEPGRNPYQERLTDNTCIGSSICRYQFAQVPVGKRLVVTQISGQFDTTGGKPPHGILHTGGFGPTTAFVPISGVLVTDGNFGVRYMINQQVLAYFGAGESVKASFTVHQDQFSLVNSLMLSGYYINLP
jgi:hypothetical protein